MEFIETLEEGDRVGVALVLKTKEESVDKEVKKEELPKELQELLQRYEGIVSDEKPSTLPPNRVVSYQNDFILGATLLNKVSYKMTSQKMRKFLN